MAENNARVGRIAKNTLILYLRMLLTMGISFFTTRITLEALGVDDYGIYNVLGGLVALCSVLSGSMVVSISRFYTLELGRNNMERMRVIFSTSVMVMTAIAIFIGILAEIGGIWFINNKMTIPIDRLPQARLAIQCFIFSFMLNLICVPYNSVIVGHERMKAFAYVTILSSVLRLGIAYALFLAPTNRLVWYAVLILGVDILNRIIYGVYCSRNFPETKFQWHFDRKCLKEMSTFTGWAFLGNGAVTIKDQGTSVILNAFCGLVVNAARGIALQITGALEALINNFMMAIQPQIYKAYASNDFYYMKSLVIKASKLSFLIIFVCAFPLCINIDYILSLWLTEVPTLTAPFIVLSIMYSLIHCLSIPLLTGILAHGDIRNYEIVITIAYLLNFGCSIIALSIGWSPLWVYIFNIIFKILILGVLMYFSKRTYRLGYKEFTIKTILPISIVSSISILAWIISGLRVAHDDTGLIIQSAVSFIIVVMITYLLGLTKSEKEMVAGFIRHVIPKKHSLI